MKRKATKRRFSLWFVVAILLIMALGVLIGEIIYRHLWSIYQTNISNTTVTETVDEPLKVADIPATKVRPSINSSTHDVIIPPIENGEAPVISSLPTKQPVVFLGIDDGVYKQNFELQIMKDNQVKASLFLVNRFIADNPVFFKSFIDEGSLIENHSLDHKLLPNLTYDEQKQEICANADILAKQYGRRPVLFRPPGGSYNQDTQRAAADCGMKAIVLWIAKANGGAMQYQAGNQLHPGDIVLMHFRPEFKQDMQAFLDAEKLAGLHTDLLEDWVK